MFVKMTFAKLYDAYLSTPAQIQDVAFGELMWATTRALIYGVAFLIVIAVMSAAGYPLLTSPWALAMPLALALIGATFALIGELFTSIIEQIDLYSYYYTLWLTPLFLFSGIFFPVSRFPLRRDHRLVHAALSRGAPVPRPEPGAADLRARGERAVAHGSVRGAALRGTLAAAEPVLEIAGIDRVRSKCGGAAVTT